MARQAQRRCSAEPTSCYVQRGGGRRPRPGRLVRGRAPAAAAGRQGPPPRIGRPTTRQSCDLHSGGSHAARAVEGSDLVRPGEHPGGTPHGGARHAAALPDAPRRGPVPGASSSACASAKASPSRGTTSCAATSTRRAASWSSRRRTSRRRRCRNRAASTSWISSARTKSTTASSRRRTTCCRRRAASAPTRCCARRCATRAAWRWRSSSCARTSTWRRSSRAATMRSSSR